MKIEKNIYPYNPEVKQFPFFLSGIGGSAYQPSVERPNGYQWHQIFHCASGHGTVVTETLTAQIHPGDYFFLPKDQPHSYYPEKEKWDVRWVSFEGSACDDTLKRLHMSLPAVIHPDKDNTLEKTFDKMVTAIETDILYSDYRCSGYIYDYILEFHRYMSSETSSEKSRNTTMLMPALRYMYEQFKTDMSVTELSALVGVTPQHFCRVFGKTMGMRPVEFLNKIRIEEAKRLLSQTDFTVAKAAEQSGFRDTCYFSTIFKRYTGVTPTAYKKDMVRTIL